MDGVPAVDARAALLELYDRALPDVYGYLLARCRERDLAEDLASETFLAAADAARSGRVVETAWLIGVARHKLADHWRRQARDRRNLQAVAFEPPPPDDPWDARLESIRACDTLADLSPQHRLALTLRYVDDLPVADVARLIERTEHATEALLVRARRAFRVAYTEGEEDGDA